jgi:hypothetical protein
VHHTIFHHSAQKIHSRTTCVVSLALEHIDDPLDSTHINYGDPKVVYGINELNNHVGEGL